MVILDVPEASVAELSAALDAADLPAAPSVFRRHTMACTGIEFCKLAIVETKARAGQVIAELERRLPDFTEPVTINVNGCPNSCARIQTADIGLKGSLVTGPDGTQTEGFQIHLGGSLGGGDGTGSGFRPEDPRAEDHSRGPAGLPGAGAAPVRGRPRDRRDLRRVDGPGQRGGLRMTSPRIPGKAGSSVLLPLLW